LSIVQIVRHDSSMALCRLHRFFGDQWRRLGKCAEDSPRVKPARAFACKNSLPIDITRFQLRNGGMTAVGTTKRRAHTKTAFGKIQAITHRAPDPIVFDPTD